ncbi:MAG: N-acetyltransferase family protein [Vicinamibacterales bacterium]|nr:N-acetyltransferase family protein [Vicinamibacterales bacterium]
MTHTSDATPGTIVRPATTADAAALARIYNHFIAHTIVTFEEEPVTAGEMARRVEEVQTAALPWLVAEAGGVVAGYAYASKWRVRRAYRFSAEVTVYLAPDQGGRGLGTALYTRLLDDLRARGVHAVLGGIALPNDASIALHEKLGFRKVAHFEQTGFKFDRWIDVGYWERLL